MKRFFYLLPAFILSCAQQPEQAKQDNAPMVQQSPDTMKSIIQPDTSVIPAQTLNVTPGTEMQKSKPVTDKKKNLQSPAPLTKTEKSLSPDTIKAQTAAQPQRIKTAEDRRKDSIIMERLKRTWK